MRPRGVVRRKHGRTYVRRTTATRRVPTAKHTRKRKTIVFGFFFSSFFLPATVGKSDVENGRGSVAATGDRFSRPVACTDVQYRVCGYYARIIIIIPRDDRALSSVTRETKSPIRLVRRAERATSRPTEHGAYTGCPYTGTAHCLSGAHVAPLRTDDESSKWFSPRRRLESAHPVFRTADIPAHSSL